MKVRFTKEIGTKVFLRAYWGSNCDHGPYKSYHNAMKHVFNVKELMNDVDADGKMTFKRFGGDIEDYTRDMFPTECDHCGEPVPEDAKLQVFNQRMYDTPSGNLEPGDLYYTPWHDDVYWDNQTSPSLSVILPNGHSWCIDSRASNCTMPEDRTHRCWVRHGNPETGEIHVDKNGHTCAAGAGSIAVPGWHGFLHNGELRQC